VHFGIIDEPRAPSKWCSGERWGMRAVRGLVSSKEAGEAEEACPEQWEERKMGANAEMRGFGLRYEVEVFGKEEVALESWRNRSLRDGAPDTGQRRRSRPPLFALLAKQTSESGVRVECKKTAQHTWVKSCPLD